jgi:hypothetical protein
MSKLEKIYQFTGVVFHLSAILYLLALIWRTVIWWNWINVLQKTLESHPERILL